MAEGEEGGGGCGGTVAVQVVALGQGECSSSDSSSSFGPEPQPRLAPSTHLLSHAFSLVLICQATGFSLHVKWGRGRGGMDRDRTSSSNRVNTVDNSFGAILILILINTSSFISFFVSFY